MRRLAVFIGTTAGPVAIERITHEPAARASLVCQGRSARQLALSDGYDSFVAPGIGAVARAFGPFADGGFRMDLSAPVSGGDSWQFAAFVAHAVHADPDAALASSVDEADAVVWLTGAVDYDFAVGAVDHVPEKLYAANDAFAAWLGEDRPVVLLLPEDGGAGSADGALPDGVVCHGVATAGEACRLLGLTLPPSMAAGVHDEDGEASLPAQRPRRRGRFALAVSLLAAALTAAALWLFSHDPVMHAWWMALVAELSSQETGGRPEKSQMPAAVPAVPVPVSASAPPSPSISPLSLALTWRRAPAGKTCVDVVFSGDEPERTRQRGPARGLCGFDAALSVEPRQPFVAADLVTLRGHLMPPDPPRRPDATSGDSWNWSFEFPARSEEPVAFVILAVAGAAPVDAALRRLRSTDDVQAVAADLRRAGHAVLVHRVDLGS